MTDTIQFHSRVGNDGQLSISVPPDAMDAGTEVIITVHRVASSVPSREEWHRFVEETYGSCAGLGLERHDQGQYEERDELE